MSMVSKALFFCLCLVFLCAPYGATRASEPSAEEEKEQLSLTHSQGRFHLQQGQLKNAEVLLAGLLEPMERVFGEHAKETHNLWLDYGTVLLGLNNLHSAEGYFHKVVEARRALGDTTSEVLLWALRGGGVAMLHAGDYSLSRAYLGALLHIQRSIGAAEPAVIYTLLRLAEVESRSNQFNEAKQHYQQVLEALSTQDELMPQERVEALIGLAALNKRLYEYSEALANLNSALAIANKNQLFDETLALAQISAEVKLEQLPDDSTPDTYAKLLNELEQQLEQIKKVYGVGDLVLPPHLVPKFLEFKLMLASLAAKANQSQLQGEYINQAAELALLKTDVESLEFAHANGAVAQALHDIELYEFEAKLLARQFAIYVKKLGEYSKSAQQVLIRLAINSQFSGDSKARETFLEQALARSPDEDFSFSLFHWLADLYVDLGENSLAAFYSKLAVNLLQFHRQDYVDYSQRADSQLEVELSFVYRRCANQLIERGRFVEAQQVLGLLKQNELKQFLRGADAAGKPVNFSQLSFTPFEEKWRQKLSSLAANLIDNSPEYQVLQVLTEAGRTEAKEARWKELSEQADSARKEFSGSLIELREAFRAQDAVRATKATETQKMVAQEQAIVPLEPGQARVQYLVLDDKLRILLTAGKHQTVHTVPIGANFSQQVFGFLETLKTPSRDPTGQAEEMYRLLIHPIKPALDEMNIEKLLLSLDGVLRYIPMAALFDGKRWLVQDYTLVNATNLSGGMVEGKGANSQLSVAGFGVSEGGVGYSPLPAVLREIDGIVKEGSTDLVGVLPGVAYLNDAFTRDALAGEVKKRHPIMHIASHFKISPAGNNASYFLLGGEQQMPVAEFQQYDLSGTKLLTLSACDTGVGNFANHDGSEIESLSALTLQQGVNSVLASLWPVNDSSTSLLMRGLYSQVQIVGTASALKNVQTAFITGAFAKLEGVAVNRNSAPDSDRRVGLGTNWRGAQDAPYSHPYYWAAFVITSDI